MALPDLNRQLIRKRTINVLETKTKINSYEFAGSETMAAILTAGFFNFGRAYLKPGDRIEAFSEVDDPGNSEHAMLKVLTVPSAGNVTVGASNETGLAVATRAVVPTSDGLTTGQLLATDTHITVASANADHIVTLPPIADVPLLKEIWGQNGATAFEMRTPATSNTFINGADADSAESVVAANAAFMVKKVSDTRWVLMTFAGATIAAPAPD